MLPTCLLRNVLALYVAEDLENTKQIMLTNTVTSLFACHMKGLVFHIHTTLIIAADWRFSFSLVGFHRHNTLGSVPIAGLFLSF